MKMLSQVPPSSIKGVPFDLQYAFDFHGAMRCQLPPVGYAAVMVPTNTRIVLFCNSKETAAELSFHEIPVKKQYVNDPKVVYLDIVPSAHDWGVKQLHDILREAGFTVTEQEPALWLMTS